MSSRKGPIHTAILRGDYAQPVAVKITFCVPAQSGRNSMREETTVVHSGLHPERHQGDVNPPVFHASPILSETVDEYRRRRKSWILEQPRTYYARFRTPTIPSFQTANAARSHGHPS